ncbi:MAG: putative beta-lysine N-acetyltransferase [Bacillota bacterium]
MELIQYSNRGHSVQVRIENYSRRLWVTGYETDGIESLSDFLIDLARDKNVEKIIFPVRVGDSASLLENGFLSEGSVNAYFKGEDSLFLAAYPSPRRALSLTYASEQRMLKEILQREQGRSKNLPEGIIVRRATTSDASKISKLFRKVFTSYPTPVYDPHYLKLCIESDDIFLVAEQGDKLAGVAAAELNRQNLRAELSDCATAPDFRGKGLNTLLLAQLEKICLSQNINCLFSLARASSYGMNLVLHRLGYEYGGTLINNCHIGGRYENMNIWVRPFHA